MVITTIGLYLIPVGIKYAAGGAADFQMNNPAWGGFAVGGWRSSSSLSRWDASSTRGLTSSAAVLIGLVAGYIVGIAPVLSISAVLASGMVRHPDAVQIWHRVQHDSHYRHVPDFYCQRHRDGW